jgi:hypothetical protein
MEEEMTTIIIPESPIAELQGRLNEIRNEISSITARRETLMITTCADLTASGIETRIVKRKASEYTKSLQVGDVVRLTYNLTLHKKDREIPVSMWPWDTSRSVGPRLTRGYFFIDSGPYEVLLIDGEEHLVAKLPQAQDMRDHTLAVGRLRTLARNEGMRLRMRDRDVTLVDPANTDAHVGTVETAFMWLMGLDPDDVNLTIV